MPDRLLETNFHTPLWRSDGVIRPRLLDRLQAGLIEQRKLTLVCAPAGCGKTTLITSWLYSLPDSTRNIWLSLEKSDNEPARFLSYWATAWNRISDFGLEDMLELLEAPQPPPFQGILDLFSRKVVGWAMEATLESCLVEQAFHMAVQARKQVMGLLHHSDRGASMYAWNWRLLRQCSHGERETNITTAKVGNKNLCRFAICRLSAPILSMMQYGSG